jgi:FkbM family methyltransferase
MEITSCIINGLAMQMPPQYLAMVRHCLVADTPAPTYIVEEAHFRWACDRLQRGDVALDIGTSAGLFAVGFSHKVGQRGHIYAFEPAKTACAMLRAVVAGNALGNVTIEAAAVGDVAGAAVFHELPADERCTWRPEASGLRVEERIPGTRSYDVPVTTIDFYLKSRRTLFGRSTVALMKIDIEGFEVHALRGGIMTIRRDRPALCIDIHRSWDDSGDTEPEVRSTLEPLGYRFERCGHVLLCWTE